jgi:preprotein translocase subunit SecA
MTGTAATEVSEFDGIYKLPVAVVPTNRSIARTDNPDVVFRTEQYKWRAVVTEIKRIHKQGRPVLVGTTSVEKSELLSDMLREEGIPHQVRVPRMGVEGVGGEGRRVPVVHGQCEGWE